MGIGIPNQPCCLLQAWVLSQQRISYIPVLDNLIDQDEVVQAIIMPEIE